MLFLSSGLSHWKQDILELEEVQKNKDYQWTGIVYVQTEIKYAVQLGNEAAEVCYATGLKNHECAGKSKR